jgi:hypothetical protein
MSRTELEVDSIEGARALLYFRDPDGRKWVAGAVLSDLRPQGHNAEPISARETAVGWALETFTLVVE